MATARAVVHPVEVQDLAALGALVTQLREQQRLSLRKAAALIGISHPYLGDIERAEINAAPSPPIVRAIAEELGGDRAELLGLAGHEEAAARAREQARPTSGEPGDEELDRLESMVARLIRDQLRAAGIEPADDNAPADERAPS